MRLLLDTNLLMLYVAGCTNRKIISSHKRLRDEFDETDYEWLKEYMGRYDGLTLTPNTATETSNLLSQIADPFRSDLRDALRVHVLSADEVYISSATAMINEEYHWLGLSDAAILTAMGPGTAMLTADLDLYLAAVARGLTAFNYVQVRFEDARWA